MRHKKPSLPTGSEGKRKLKPMPLTAFCRQHHAANRNIFNQFRNYVENHSVPFHNRLSQEISPVHASLSIQDRAFFSSFLIVRILTLFCSRTILILFANFFVIVRELFRAIILRVMRTTVLLLFLVLFLVLLLSFLFFLFRCNLLIGNISQSEVFS